jgi:stage IV sporulation protein FB
MNGPIYLFSARAIPVFAEPFFFLLVLFMVSSASSVQNGIVWALCVTFSVLVHELGHAFVAAWYKLQPAVVLHGWGGFTIHEPARRDRHDALIVAAGPAAGLLLGAVVLGASWIAEAYAPGAIAARPLLERAVDSLLFVNLFWSFVNLVPMFPLDGGLLFRLGAKRLLAPSTAEKVVHGLGLALALAWSGVALQVFDSVFLLIMGLMFAWENFAILTRRKASPRSVHPFSELADQLLGDAKKAWADGNAREAARLCHQLRAEANVAPETMDGAFAILVQATSSLGQHEQAVSFARHAPVSPGVIQARLTSLVALGKQADARALLAEHGALLPADARRQLEQKVSA